MAKASLFAGCTNYSSVQSYLECRSLQLFPKGVSNIFGYRVATICALIVDIRTLSPTDSRGAYGRALPPKDLGREPLRHKDMLDEIELEKTQFLYPDATQQQYNPGQGSPRIVLRSLSPAAGNSRGHSPDGYQDRRRERSVSPGRLNFKDLE